ncbi:acetyltransferase [Salinimicrobium sp. CDJ15-81-2]|nr:acetyltransferase [Salinimicrobium nanhaiense]
MEEKKLIIYGMGRFAEYVRYVFDQDSSYKVEGFCIERSYSNDEEFDGLPLYVFENLEFTFSTEEIFLFIAVGENSLRQKFFEQGLKKGFSMATYVSSKAETWPNLIIGQNCFIGEGSIIQPFVRIGNNSIHFGSRIGHHSSVMDHTLLSGTTIGGNTRIGEGSYLGLNSTVQQNIHIGSKNIIGMNVSIEENTAENSVYTHKGSQKRALTYDQIAQRFLL